MSTMSNLLPNSALLQHLLKTYYSESPSSVISSQQSAVSSYWRHYSGLFEVQVDSQGKLLSLSGIGFGNYSYRTPLGWLLNQLCIVAHLSHLPHRVRLLALLKMAVTVLRRMGLKLTMDAFRQACTLELIERYLPSSIREKRLCVLMIGDGYGVLAALFKTVFPQSTLVMVDIGKTLLFQAYYCQKAHPELVHALFDQLNSGIEKVDFLYCPVEHLAMLERLKFDIAINIASMQEMTPEMVAEYFAFMRRHLQTENLFYCCNRESKTLVGGEVLEFAKYPWCKDDRHSIDEYCPWHQYFFGSYRTQKGLSVFGRRVPFVNFYDGKILHRLTVLAKDMA